MRDQPPAEMMDCVRVYGFITMELSDEHLRARLGARRALHDMPAAS